MKSSCALNNEIFAAEIKSLGWSGGAPGEINRHKAKTKKLHSTRILQSVRGLWELPGLRNQCRCDRFFDNIRSCLLKLFLDNCWGESSASVPLARDRTKSQIEVQGRCSWLIDKGKARVDEKVRAQGRRLGTHCQRAVFATIAILWFKWQPSQVGLESWEHKGWKRLNSADFRCDLLHNASCDLEWLMESFGLWGLCWRAVDQKEGGSEILS